MDFPKAGTDDVTQLGGSNNFFSPYEAAAGLLIFCLFVLFFLSKAMGAEKKHQRNNQMWVISLSSRLVSQKGEGTKEEII